METIRNNQSDILVKSTDSLRNDLKHLAAYLLASLSGNTPTAETINTILSSVGIESDAAQVEKLISALEGKEISALIAEGAGKLSSMPAVGAAPAASAGGAAPAAAGGKAEAKKEEKKEEKEESDDDMGFGLFD